MPTGYTADVQDGKVTTLRDFALRCIRGLGVCVMMRDDPWDAPTPQAFEPHTKYHDEHLAAAKKLLDELPGLPLEVCEARARAEFDAAMAYHTSSAAERALQKQRYEIMKARVEDWKIPEEIAGLKTFMLEQLTQSIDFDCSESFREAPTRLTGERWREKQLEAASRDVAYHTVEREKEIQRTAKRNEFMAAFWKALPAAETPAEAA